MTICLSSVYTTNLRLAIASQGGTTRYTSSTFQRTSSTFQMHHVTSSHTNTVLKLKLFLTSIRSQTKYFITPACSNMTKDLSSVFMRWMDLVKANLYKKCLLLENTARGPTGTEGFYASWTIKSRILELVHERFR